MKVQSKLNKTLFYVFAYIWCMHANAQYSLMGTPKVFGGKYSGDYGNVILVDNQGNTYFTGQFLGKVDFDPGPNLFELSSTLNIDRLFANCDGFISKLDAEGNFLWAKRFGGADFEEIKAMAFDSDGNIVATGYYGTDLNITSESLDNSFAQGGGAFFLKMTPNGNLIWAKSTRDPVDNENLGLALDKKNNIYITGRFKSTLDCDPGTGVYNLTTLGDNDAFLAKYDHKGNFLWAKQLGGDNFDIGSHILLDHQGSLYWGGQFSSLVDFDPGVAVSKTLATGSADIFVVKLDTSGNYKWAKKLGGINTDCAKQMLLDGQGHIYMAGYFEGTAYFNLPNTNYFTVTSAGWYDILVAKMDTTGYVMWAKGIGSTTIDGGSGILLDAAGFLHIAGSFSNTVDFDPGVNSFPLKSARKDIADIFLLQLDQNGNFITASQMGGTYFEYVSAIFMDKSGTIHMLGEFEGTTNLGMNGNSVSRKSNEGYRDIFLCKIGQKPLTLENKQEVGHMYMFPNPISDMATIVLDKPYKNINLSIRNSLGQELMSMSYSAAEAIQIDTDFWTAGMYLVNIDAENDFHFTYKIMKK